MTLVGTYVGLSRWLVTAFPVLVLAGLRFAIAAVCLLPWMRRRSGEARLRAQDHRRLFTIGLFGNVLFTLCILQGVAWSSAMAAGVVMAALPGVVALLARAWLKEPVQRSTWLGVACAIAGVALVALQGHAGAAHIAPHPNALWGHGLLLCAVLCEAINLVLARPLAQTVSPQRITALVNLWSLLLMAPLALWQAWSLPMAHISAGHWAALAFYAVASSVVSVWLWMVGAQHVPAARAGLFTVCLPVAATTVGVLWLGETMTLLKAAALALALLGIVLATRR
jgi:drug/metabolite transporter (DMT)-like permease